MNRKMNKWRMGLAVPVLCALLFMTALPSAADYTADKPLTVYEQGTIQGVIDGGLTYTIGDSYYSGKLMNDHDGDNIAKFQNGRYEPNGGDRMMTAANAFLVIKYRGSEEAVGRTP